MESTRDPFHVKDCALAIATGLRAFTLEEFRETLRGLAVDSIYYHFWGGLLQPRFEEREFNNDFAAWSDKNIGLKEREIEETRARFGIDAARPLVVRISRFDRFKDPVGVIRAYRMAKECVPALQLVLAGGGAADDPEGEAVPAETRLAEGDDPDIHILPLPPDLPRVVNALQRMADIVVQKSTREGFGLTVTEAMWKGMPVIGGDVGGIRLQVIDHHTGFRVSTPEGASLRIRCLLHQPKMIRTMGWKAQQFVREKFLLTRQLREHLAMAVGLLLGTPERIEPGSDAAPFS